MSDYIDSHSEYSLYDVLEGSIPRGKSTEFYGLHIVSQTKKENKNSRFIVQLDGHVGSIKQIDSDDYSDVLEVVDVLMGIKLRVQEERRGGKESLVDYAGKIMTADKEKAEDSELYTYAPIPTDDKEQAENSDRYVYVEDPPQEVV